MDIWLKHQDALDYLAVADRDCDSFDSKTWDDYVGIQSYLAEYIASA